MRGSPALRTAVPPFEPQPEALAALSRRLKAQFDPRGILNPGRMPRAPGFGGARSTSARLLTRRNVQTNFSLAQLADPKTAEAESILRRCVHCGFCLATCPTYLVLGNELDSPRGRIYLIKDMLENDKPASTEVVTHIDRCLSCLSCVTTCPSGVDYMHLVDQARVRIEKTYRRPFGRPLRARAARPHPSLSRPLPPRAARWRSCARPLRADAAEASAAAGTRLDAMLRARAARRLPREDADRGRA